MICSELSEKYFTGDGVDRDESRGQTLRDRACKLGDADACEPREPDYDEHEGDGAWGDEGDGDGDD
jgi:TPR repeat protein